MPNWLKGLVAAACVVICAGGAVYAWAIWRQSHQAEDNRAAAFELLQAAPGDIEKATQTCTTIKRNLGLADGLSWDNETRNYARQLLIVCEANGFMPSS